MEANYAEQLPAGWVFKTKARRNGTMESFYHNPQTGQKFSTKEHLDRYLNYQNNISPRLDDLRECYGDGRGRFVETPWVTDPNHNLDDYIYGRVGKVKEKKEMETSCITSNETASDMEETSCPNAEGKSMKSKGKGKAKRNK